MGLGLSKRAPIYWHQTKGHRRWNLRCFPENTVSQHRSDSPSYVPNMLLWGLLVIFEGDWRGEGWGPHIRLDRGSAGTLTGGQLGRHALYVDHYHQTRHIQKHVVQGSEDDRIVGRSIPHRGVGASASRCCDSDIRLCTKVIVK